MQEQQRYREQICLAQQRPAGKQRAIARLFASCTKPETTFRLPTVPDGFFDDRQLHTHNGKAKERK